MKIAIIDYKIGNVRSIYNSLENLADTVVLTSNPSDILNSDGVVFPGVGAFEKGMALLQDSGLDNTIYKLFDLQKPLLGICLGMQLLFEKNQEFGFHQGLGIVAGSVEQIPLSKVAILSKLPHIGWTHVLPQDLSWEGTILDGISESDEFYFVHSFYCAPQDKKCILSMTKYGNFEFCSSIKVGSFFGCQFHPERSAGSGLALLKNFIQFCVRSK